MTSDPDRTQTTATPDLASAPPATLPCQKHRFSLPDGLHYLNCAYMAPLPDTVEAAGITGIRRKRIPTDLPPEAFFDESLALRRSFARLVDLDDPHRIAIIPAVSYGMATVASNTPVGQGQNVVVLHEQFPSNVYAWHRLTRSRGAELRTVDPPEGLEGRGARWNERILEQIDADTALVALGHVHWADGTLFDLAAIGRRAREVGAALIVDGTQSVGALPFSVREFQPDALICAGYKWLFGPYSLGVAYYGPRYDEGTPLEESWLLRRNSENFSGLVQYQDDYQPGALRYDVGERSNFILVPMLKAAIDLLNEWGVANVQAYCRRLNEPLLEEAERLGFAIEDETWRGAHLFGVRLPQRLPMERVSAALEARSVMVSVRGNALRISPNVYNEAADVDALCEALREARG